MAILKLGELVAGIRGTVGGTIYSANKSGPFARGWSKGPNPRTIAQTTQRAHMASHMSYWLDITQGQRDDWDAYAAHPDQELTNSLGEAYYATGFNWFLRINNHQLSTLEARRLLAPDRARPGIPTINYLLFESPIVDDLHARIGNPTNTFLGFMCIIYLAFAPSTALTWKSRGYLLVYADKGVFTTQERFGFRTLLKFGQPLIGSKAFARVQRQGAQGQRSTAATITTTVV